ncbi:PH domain-containing protein [Glycomyces sp. TRM65418]|uniref:PH domain-containing protein n=1 Tax=Glycomyces sp. TRM65418 TaxID=2867006 RepID=UPI001CE70B6C|nr:PH domain-containing protein [Glycomyces sp. TRM65418]MCC3765420.1 PH domain-containing protein [Glycomyces sp. TRM65418]QZD55030.1 PH domain-containing protein [Glycomyces sp. TRM65418]
MTSSDASGAAPISGSRGSTRSRRLRVRRSAAITGAAFVAWLTVAPLSLALIVEQPLWGPFSAALGVALLFAPVTVSVWAWRSGVDVTREGIAVRGLFTSRTIAWKHIDGFATGDEGVAAILDDQSQVRLAPLRPENLPQVLEIGGQEVRREGEPAPGTAEG